MPEVQTGANGGAIAHGDADDVKLAQQAESTGQFMELGLTGLKRAAGHVDEEFLPQLRGRKAVQVYREMGDNDPIVGALMFAIQQLVRNVDWPVTAAGKSRDHANAARLVETAMDDMSHSWDDMLTEILSCLQYGWAWHETVYKRRVGPWEKDGRRRSKYTDGLVAWRKIPIRSQETLQRWLFDESGGVRGMVQLAPPTYETRVLPITRSGLFRFGAHKNNPEGRSILRNAYRPWFYKKRLEEFESVGVERDLAGLPIVKVPASFLKAKKGTPQARMVEQFQKMVRSVRRDEQEGLVFPVEYDQDTRQPLYNFELLGGGGGRAFNTGEIIQRYEQRILMTVLADFIMVGHQATGTYNMHLDKTGLFKAALNSIVDSIADVFNRHLIPRLFAANGWKPAELPTIEPSEVDAPNLTELASFLQATAGLGFNWAPDADMERFLRQTAGLPELGEDDEKRHRTMARREEAARMAESQTRVLAARSELAQAMAQQQMMAAGEPTPDQADPQGQMQVAGQAQQQAQSDEQHQQRMAHTQETHEQRLGFNAQTQDQRLRTATQRAASQNGQRNGGGSR